MTAKHSQAATPPAEPTYSHEETERLLNAFGAWACGNLADGSSAHWNIRQVAAQLARADKRVTWCEKELSEMRLLVNGYFSTADALTKTEDERDRLQRENEELRTVCRDALLESQEVFKKMLALITRTGLAKIWLTENGHTNLGKKDRTALDRIAALKGNEL